MSANEIIPNIWLGDKTASQSKVFLERMNIGLIVNCTKDIPFCEGVTCEQLRLPVDDNLMPEEIAFMTKNSPRIIRKIWKIYSSGIPVFIHCYAGVQRSASIVAMFLIFFQRCSMETAIHRIQHRRPIAFRPKINFATSIRSFERNLNKKLEEMSSR